MKPSVASVRERATNLAQISRHFPADVPFRGGVTPNRKQGRDGLERIVERVSSVSYPSNFLFFERFLPYVRTYVAQIV